MPSHQGDKAKASAKMAEVEKTMRYESEKRMSEPSYHDNIIRSRESALSELEPSDARIMYQLEFMGEQLGAAYELLYELEERISHILLPPFPQPSNPDMPGQTTSTVSRIVDEHNSRILGIQDHLRMLNRRVQL